MTDIIKLQQKLDRLIRKSFDSFISYKKIAKTFDNSKKLMEKNLDIEQIEKKLSIVESQLENLKKVNIPINDKVSLNKKFEEQKKIYEELLKHAKENNSNKWLVELETKFLKGKEFFRENKIILLGQIQKILLVLKKQMGAENYKEYIKQLYLNKLTDDTNTYTYTVKTIMDHLQSGPISEEASKKSTQLNELKSKKNIKNRKVQMEIEIEMIKLLDNTKKYRKYENLFIDKIKKIIDKHDDDMMKAKLFEVVIRNKRNNNFKVITNNKGNPVKEEVVDIKPNEFKKFKSSKNEKEYYQKEIDKYNEKLDKLQDKNKSIRIKIAELKGIDLKKLKASEKNSNL